MKITGLIWLDHIADKLYQKHNVMTTEVREVFDNQPQFRFVEKGHRPGENVYFILGQSDAERRRYEQK